MLFSKRGGVFYGSRLKAPCIPPLVFDQSEISAAGEYNYYYAQNPEILKDCAKGFSVILKDLPLVSDQSVNRLAKAWISAALKKVLIENSCLKSLMRDCVTLLRYA